MAAPAPTATCHWCGEPLVYLAGEGYRHPGGLYVQWCPDCHKEFTCRPTATRCPFCGGRQVRDRHCARPDQTWEARA